MKISLYLLAVAVLAGIAGCTSEPSTNPNPRRTFDANSGSFEGPTPMPPPNSNGTGSH